MSEYTFYNEKMLKAPGPLSNCGANCWWNALLQSLMSCPGFIQKLSEIKAPGPLAREFLGQFTADNFSSIVLLGKCAQECRKQGKTLDLLSQEGTSNGLIVLLELLGDSNLENLFANRYRVTFTCDKCNKLVSTSEDMSYVITIYKTLSTEEEFVDYIKGHWAPLTDYKCPNCGQIISGPNLRYEKLSMLREILPIIFNKGILQYGKMTLPPKLRFKTYSNSPLEHHFLVYEPVSQIEHTGHIDTARYTSSGHYWARVFRPGGTQIANDSFISPAEKQPISITPNTHMVFYHLIGIEKISAITQEILPEKIFT